MFLMEMLVYVTLMVVAINVLTITFMRFKASYERVDGALRDLDVGDRFLADVKADLRSCRAVVVEERLLRLTGPDGGQVVYAMDEEDGSVHRTGSGPSRDYLYAFSLVRFTQGENRTVLVEVELRKRDPSSPVRPRIGTTVYCRNEGK